MHSVSQCQGSGPELSGGRSSLLGIGLTGVDPRAPPVPPDQSTPHHVISNQNPTTFCPITPNIMTQLFYIDTHNNGPHALFKII